MKPIISHYLEREIANQLRYQQKHKFVRSYELPDNYDKSSHDEDTPILIISYGGVLIDINEYPACRLLGKPATVIPLSNGKNLVVVIYDLRRYKMVLYVGEEVLKEIL